MLCQAMPNPPPPEWIEPTQTRSRQKVVRVLEAARTLLVQHSTLDLKMTDVAKAAGVAVGTLYQFFPSRTALIQKLFAEEMSVIDLSVEQTFYTLSDVSALSAQIEKQLSGHIDLVRSRPAMMVIWGSVAVDPAVQSADLINTRQNAAVLAERILGQLGPDADATAVLASATLVCHLWSSVIRLCVQADPDEARAIIRQYSKMIATHTQSLAP
ncbi:MAG: TetR/AcrR family transcriptional regulator [Pseudomonadota bacterium]